MQASKTNTRKVFHNSMDDIRGHASGITADVREIGEAVKNALIEKLTGMLKRAITFGEESRETARDLAVNARDNIEKRIQEKPYKAVLLAAGFGVALGFMLRRK